MDAVAPEQRVREKRQGQRGDQRVVPEHRGERVDTIAALAGQPDRRCVAAEPPQRRTRRSRDTSTVPTTPCAKSSCHSWPLPPMVKLPQRSQSLLSPDRDRVAAALRVAGRAEADQRRLDDARRRASIGEEHPHAVGLAVVEPRVDHVAERGEHDQRRPGPRRRAPISAPRIQHPAGAAPAGRPRSRPCTPRPIHSPRFSEYTTGTIAISQAVASATALVRRVVRHRPAATMTQPTSRQKLLPQVFV